MIINELIPRQFTKRFTKNAEQALASTLQIAKRYPQAKNPQMITSEHLLYALTLQDGSVAKNALRSGNISPDTVLRFLQKNIVRTDAKKEPRKASATLKRAIKNAASCALQNKQHFVGTEHLLWGILKQNEESSPIPARKIKLLEHYLDDIILSSLSIDALANSTPQFAQKSDMLTAKKYFEAHEHEMEQRGSATKVRERHKTVLAEFCKDLSTQAACGLLDPVVGREAELDRIVYILSRRNKSNPLLVGDPGVGKTALVNGLALRIVEGKVPQNLQRKRIYALNLSSLIAGTMFRGEFEERMRDLVEEASNEDVILFIDEVHTLVGAGSAQGSMDAANILKPALVHNEFRCIGATTFEEYKKSIEKDGALERRFQKIIIKQETPQQAIQTLMRLRPLYEKHHNIKIDDNIIRLVVELAVKYIPQRALPDKALDILDEACAYTRTKSNGHEYAQNTAELEAQLHEIMLHKDRALAQHHYKKALYLKDRQKMLESATTAYRDATGLTKYATVSKEAVYKAVAEIAGIPVASIHDDERAVLANLERTLRKYIVGQDTAIKRVAQAIRRNRTGIRKYSRPIGSFMFLGPSGVGKTELAKVLAAVLSAKNPASPETPSTLIKLDMSEFAEQHTVARLIGAPPGYIGYEEAGYLTEKIRRTPHAVVLFDEIEKAHPRVFNLLLQILEDGVLTDAQGKTADFKNAVIIMTSNIGTERLDPNTHLGFTPYDKNHAQSVALSSLKDIIRPEIINRIDNIIVFNALNENALKHIAKFQLAELTNRLEDKLAVDISPAIIDWVVRQATNKTVPNSGPSPRRSGLNHAGGQAGARGIRHVIETEIEERIAEEIIKHNPKKLKIAISRGKISVL